MCPGGLYSLPARAWLAIDTPAHLVLSWYGQDVLTAFRGQWWESRNRHIWDLGPCGDWMEPRWWSLEACRHCRDQPWRQWLRENGKRERIVQVGRFGEQGRQHQIFVSMLCVQYRTLADMQGAVSVSVRE